MSRGISIGCALLLACASSSPSTEVAISAPADIEIVSVQPSPPSTTSAAVLATTEPPPAPTPWSLCDQYWVRLRACTENAVKDLDPQNRATAMKALEDAEQQTREVFDKMEGVALDAACRVMMDSLAQYPNCSDESR